MIEFRRGFAFLGLDGELHTVVRQDKQWVVNAVNTDTLEQHDVARQSTSGSEIDAEHEEALTEGHLVQREEARVIEMVCRGCKRPAPKPEPGRYSVTALNMRVLLCAECAHDIALAGLRWQAELATCRCRHCGGPVTDGDLIHSTAPVLRCATCREGVGGQR